MLNRFVTLTQVVDKIDPIKHVVLLMLENHSFDQMLGIFKQKYPEMEGVDTANPAVNLDNKDKKIFQTEIKVNKIPLDPYHELPNVLVQISDNSAGFVKDFVSNYPKCTEEDKQNVMGYYPKGYLPALHTLANEFTICDHWFCSVPGPTWTNRFFALSGTSSGQVHMPTGIEDPQLLKRLFGQNQKNIFDRLDEANVSWRTYFYDFPISLVLTHQREPDNLMNYHRIERFFFDALGPACEFPAFSFIEPQYMGSNPNDDHPPHDAMRAQKLIADVYNIIRANKELWESTLFVVTYDEHGGFYDHVQPPAAVPPDNHQEEYTFDKLGPRVPTILVSPWVKAGLDTTVYDHTSLLKYMVDKWHLGGLGERVNQANNIVNAFDFSQGPRQDCVSYIYVPQVDAWENTVLESWNLNSNHLAIYAFAEFLRNSKNLGEFSIFSKLGCKALAKKKMGQSLVKFGLWLEKDAIRHEQARVDNAGKVADRFLGLFANTATAVRQNPPIEEESKAEAEPEPVSVIPAQAGIH